MSKQIAAALFGLAAALMTRDALACPEGQFEMDGRCWNIGYQCSDYDGTTSRVCNNGSDDLRCDWDSRSHTCYPEGCRPGQFEMDGRCWNIGYQCSDYDGTTSRVCNNGSDDLRCDWDSRSHTCYPEY